MAAKRRLITYFVEDEAQNAFISAIVHRLAREIGVSIRDDVRSVLWGGRTLVELRAFLRDEQRRNAITTDLLIISIDGNCKGYVEKRNEIVKIVDQSHYSCPYVCAIPDPHIERWYLCDSEAVRIALSADIHPTVPAYKCERDLYKILLRRVIEDAEQEVLLGGAEHGEAIVNGMDLYAAGQREKSLGHFVTDLRSALQALAQT